MFHPRLDLGRRAQHWAWYWQIRNIADLSEGKLERVFAGTGQGGGRRRSFYRVRTLGSSPQDERGFMNRAPIYKLVHDSPVAWIFEPAKSTFLSPFWEVVCKRDMAAARRDEVISILMHRLGLVRTPTRVADGLRLLIRDEELLRQLGVGIPTPGNLTLLADTGHPDVLALLCALYLERLSVRDLQAALRLAEAIEICAVTFEASLQWPIENHGLLIRLVSDRILRNRWLTERDYREQLGADQPASASRSEAGRRREVRAFVDWYLSPDRGDAAAERDGWPYPSNTAWHWLATNEGQLQSWVQQLHRYIDARRVGNLSSDRSEVIARVEVDIAHLRSDVVNRVQDLAKQSGADWQARLPGLFPSTGHVHEAIESAVRANAFERFVQERLSGSSAAE